MLAFAAAVSLFAAAAARAVDNPFPKAGAGYVVERDGRRLWEGNPDKRLPPASLAKMMTALLVIEDGGLGKPVTVGKAAAAETPTKLGLRAGERFTKLDLLTAAVVRSANDACRALAEDAGGEAAFVARMNARAETLGMRDTRFLNACGHDADGQYTTASDLALLANAVAARPEYMKLAGLPRASIRALGGGRTFSFGNTNAFIGRFPGALGLKTGTTPAAGTCVAALAERDGARVLMILLGSPDRWWGGDALLARAFAAGTAAKAP